MPRKTAALLAVLLAAPAWGSPKEEPYGPRVTSIVIKEIAQASKPDSGRPNLRNSVQEAMIESLEAMAALEKAGGPRQALKAKGLRKAFNKDLKPALVWLAASFNASRMVTTQTAISWTNRRLASLGAPQDPSAPACPGEETLRTLRAQNRKSHAFAARAAKVSTTVARRLKAPAAAARALAGTEAGGQLAEACAAMQRAADLALELSRRQRELTAEDGPFDAAIEKARACGAGADWQAGADAINAVTDRMVQDIELLMAPTPIEANSFPQFLQAAGEL